MFLNDVNFGPETPYQYSFPPLPAPTGRTSVSNLLKNGKPYFFILF